MLWEIKDSKVMFGFWKACTKEKTKKNRKKNDFLMFGYLIILVPKTLRKYLNTIII